MNTLSGAWFRKIAFSNIANVFVDWSWNIIAFNVLFHQYHFYVNQAVKKTFKEFLCSVLCEADHQARKSAYEPNGSFGRAYPWKPPKVFLANSGRVPSALNSPVPIYTPGFREALCELYVLPNWSTQRNVPGQGSNPDRSFLSRAYQPWLLS